MIIITSFTPGTLIVLSGKSDKNITVVQGTEDVVWVAPDLRAATIMVSVYNVLPVIHFNVQRFPSGNLPTAIHVKSVSSDGLDHVTKYEIVLTRITNDTAGRYQIKVHDNSGEVKKHFKMFQVMSKFLKHSPVHTTVNSMQAYKDNFCPCSDELCTLDSINI